MEELSELLLQRRRKVDSLWEAGINPYPNDFSPSHTSADFSAAYGDKDQIDAKDDVLATAGLLNFLIDKLKINQQERIKLFKEFSGKFVRLSCFYSASGPKGPHAAVREKG